VARFEVVDAHTVRDEDGREYNVLQAIAALPWVSQLCPVMPHQYVVFSKSDPVAYSVLEAMVGSGNRESYRAYFRGYQSPNRCWEAPDGLRYWATRFMLNRCTPDSVEPLRRVDAGAKAIRDWDGPPYAPNGSGIYQRAADGRWWPTQAALASGYQPCKACQRRPRTLGRRVVQPDGRATSVGLRGAADGLSSRTPGL
jgi:hypothetical protein